MDPNNNTISSARPLLDLNLTRPNAIATVATLAIFVVVLSVRNNDTAAIPKETIKGSKDNVTKNPLDDLILNDAIYAYITPNIIDKPDINNIISIEIPLVKIELAIIR